MTGASEAAAPILAAKLCANEDGEPIFVRARVWGLPSWLFAAHLAAVAKLVCSPTVGVTDLHVGMVKATTRPDCAETLLEVGLTVAVPHSPERGPLGLEGRCAHCIREVQGILLAALRAEDPEPAADATGVIYRRWMTVLCDMTTMPLVTPRA